jgi:hypothetical protein
MKYETDPDHEAYPTQSSGASGELTGGLNKREYFASQALVAIAATYPHDPKKAATQSVIMADELIKALNQNSI